MIVLQLNVEDRKREANWFDVGIIKGTSCTVSSYYLPNGDLEKSEIDIEVSRTDLFSCFEELDQLTIYHGKSHLDYKISRYKHISSTG